MKIADIKSIEYPSLAYIKKKIDSYEDDERWIRQYKIIINLFNKYPYNTESDFDTVAQKVSLLNDYYGTHIQDTYGFAKHIISDVQDFDEKIRMDDPEEKDSLINRLGSFQGRHMYSFATKFCHFHNSENFPIYDSNVEKALKCYRKYGILNFKNDELKNYRDFREIINKFRILRVQELSENEKKNGLEWLSYKITDQFLWNLGKDINGRIDEFIEQVCSEGLPINKIIEDVFDEFGVEVTEDSINQIKNQARLR